MKTCISIWHWPKHPRWYDEGLRETLQFVHDAGFTHINWNPDAGHSYQLANAEIEFTAKLVRESGLKVKSVHASNGRNQVLELRAPRGRLPVFENRKDIGSSHEWQRKGGIELLKNRIDLASALSSPDIVLHVDITDEVFLSAASEAEFFDPFWRSFDELADYCVEHKVKIAIENLMGAVSESWLKLYDRIFERYDSNFLGLCFDVGHWNVAAGPSDLSILDTFGHRLIATHIHDNFGSTDDHLLPFSGTIDWQKVTSAIAATKCEMPLNLETPPDLLNMPERSFFRRAYSSASRLENMIESKRHSTV